MDKSIPTFALEKAPAHELPIVFSPNVADQINPKTVAKKYYNSFNFPKLSSAYGNLHMTIGIISANKGEGKTHVAANMAVSLAKAFRRRTVLVDLNFKTPTLHSVFGTPLEPGVTEALMSRILKVVPTGIEHLYLMPAGDYKVHQPGIEQTLALRELLFTLKSEFDFIIIDMCSVFPINDFPVHYINEIDGLITVVDTRHTRKAALDRIFKHIDEKRIIGYVFNKVDKKV